MTKNEIKNKLLDLLSRDESWVILVSPDPDALASAMALKRILARRVKHVSVRAIFPVTRPDNLAMIRYLKIPVKQWIPQFKSIYDRFALVDSQPHHNKAFDGINFDIVIDHHPMNPQYPITAAFTDIRPDIGATSTLMAKHLSALKIRPTARLATAIQYGIRTDTAAFTRGMTETDIGVYLQMSKYGDPQILTRIMRSEYLLPWLPYFSRAIASLHKIARGGVCFAGKTDSHDLPVVIADFFTRVSGLEWIAVCGICHDSKNPHDHKAVVVFRSDGRRNIGQFAADTLGDLGTAGGHPTMARAEFSLSSIKPGQTLESAIIDRLSA